MPKKLYYTDPLAAGYMAREFGIEFEEDTLKSILEVVDNKKADPPFIIHPDSLDKFKPMVGDLAQKRGRSSCHYCGMDWLLLIEDEYELGLYKDDITKIIQRNGKPFFWPEEEDAK